MDDSVEDLWVVMHAYRRAVRRGLAEPFLCTQDNDELVPQIGIRDEPVLKCLYCKTIYHIGLDMWDEMKRKAK